MLFLLRPFALQYMYDILLHTSYFSTIFSVSTSQYLAFYLSYPYSLVTNS